MQKFLAQFNLRPALELALEGFMFGMAGQKVKGYNGGVWEDKEVGKGVFITLLPFRGEESFTMSDAYGTTDAGHVTVSAALSCVAVNWFWHKYANVMTDAENRKMQKYYDGLRAAVYRKNADHGIDTNKYFTLTD